MPSLGTMKRKLLVIVGPTAVGKSALSVELARTYNGEIISADSRQIYTGLDIGTGKITVEEMKGVPHHLIDVANPKKQFSVAEYQTLAREKMDDIFSRGNIPIICGGTGLYIDALLGKVVIPNVPPNPKLRKQLEKKSVIELFAMLKRLDSRRAEGIDPHNPRRLIRAIEIAKALGTVPRYADILKNNSIDVEPLYVGLMLPSEVLRQRIHDRLLSRLDEGMLIEATELHRKGLSWKRMEDLGLEYRYMSRHLRGLISQEEMITQLQSEIWRYAKRQMTWFRRNTEIKWFLPKQTADIERKVRNFLKS